MYSICILSGRLLHFRHNLTIFAGLKTNSQGRVQFPTGGDSPRLPDYQGLNRCNSGTDGKVRMEEETVMAAWKESDAT